MPIVTVWKSGIQPDPTGLTVGYNTANKSLNFYQFGALSASVSKTDPNYSYYMGSFKAINPQAIRRGDYIAKKTEAVSLMDYAPRFSLAGQPASDTPFSQPDAADHVFGQVALK